MSADADIVAAVATADRERVRALIEEDPNRAAPRDGAGLSIILSACYQGNLDLLNILLSEAPPLDIFEAAAIGQAGRVASLLAGDPTLARAYSSDGFTALHLAAYFGQIEAARRLLELGADANAVSHNGMQVMPLHSAVSAGHYDLSELLVAHGAVVNARQQHGWTPLHGAAQNGDERLAELLISRGAALDFRMDDGRSAAAIAAGAGHALLAERLRPTVS